MLVVIRLWYSVSESHLFLLLSCSLPSVGIWLFFGLYSGSCKVPGTCSLFSLHFLSAIEKNKDSLSTGYWWWSLQIILCAPKGRNWSSRVKEGGLGTTFVCGTMKIRCFCWYNSSETLFYLSLAAQGKLDQIIST